MLERKLITAAEAIHNAALKVSLRLLNRRTKKMESRLAREKVAAERISEAALEAIARAGVFYQEAQGRYSSGMREANALSNEIENRLDDLAFPKKGE